VNETLALLEVSLPYDGIFFDIHGAMSVVGLMIRKEILSPEFAKWWAWSR
jgi:hypothetical protein